MPPSSRNPRRGEFSDWANMSPDEREHARFAALDGAPPGEKCETCASNKTLHPCAGCGRGLCKLHTYRCVEADREGTRHEGCTRKRWCQACWTRHIFG